jgi:hypothetical protein
VGEDNILVVPAPENIFDDRIDFREFKGYGIEGAKGYI